MQILFISFAKLMGRSIELTVSHSWRYLHSNNSLLLLYGFNVFSYMCYAVVPFIPWIAIYNVTGLLCNYRDTVYYHTTFISCLYTSLLLSKWIPKWARLHMTTAYIHDHAPMGMANYAMIDDLIGQCHYTYMHLPLIIYSSENTELLFLNPLSFINTHCWLRPWCF